MEITIALATRSQPFGAFSCTRLPPATLFKNATTRVMNTTLVASCKAKPAISISIPAVPDQFWLDATPEPEAWTKKEKISDVTKTRVTNLGSSPSNR